MTQRFTPGPWHVEKCDRWKRSSYIRAATGLRIGYAYSDVQKMHRGETEANARLIAAAPDLYAACEAAVFAANHIDCVRAMQEVLPQLRAALAKAGGGASPDA